MAASICIEEESGTHTGRHPHNGYYAGDFSDVSTSDLTVANPAI